MTEPTNKPLQVLIIEDNPGDAELVGILLAEADPARHDCHHVSTLGAGVACLREKAFDVVLLDLGLPDGFDPWRAETLGLTLVTSLTRQIDGTLTVVPRPGAGFALRIPLPEQ